MYVFYYFFIRKAINDPISIDKIDLMKHIKT